MDDRNRDRDTARHGRENQVKGAAKEVEGKVRGGIGDALDDGSEHVKGRAKEVEGKVQRKVGEAEEKLGTHAERDDDARDIDRDDDL